MTHRYACGAVLLASFACAAFAASTSEDGAKVCCCDDIRVVRGVVRLTGGQESYDVLLPEPVEADRCTVRLTLTNREVQFVSESTAVVTSLDDDTLTIFAPSNRFTRERIIGYEIVEHGPGTNVVRGAILLSGDAWIGSSDLQTPVDPARAIVDLTVTGSNGFRNTQAIVLDLQPNEITVGLGANSSQSVIGYQIVERR